MGKTFVLLIILFISQYIIAQTTNTEVIAVLDKVFVDNSMVIKANAMNQTELHKSLRYTFTTFQTTQNGKILKTPKEERFTLQANERKELNQFVINRDFENKLIILLLIYEEDQIVSKARLAFNDHQKKEEIVEDISDDGIELKGIVIEETKTKPGKDFYEFFYNAYNRNKINGNRIVGIFEKLSFGRSTIIQVKVEDKLLHEFLGKPDQEYLEQMSNQAIRKVFKYFKDLKKQKDDIFRY